jgi:DNA repair protein SbcD/Mre11
MDGPKVLHFSDLHLGSGLNHGKVNPATGLNTRFEDFLSSLCQCIDYAIETAIDLVMFGGDAFPDATPPPFVQNAFAAQVRRLTEAQIPVVLLVGNHDQYAQGEGGASLSIYRTLGLPQVIVGDRLETHCIETRHGPVQVITLPWLNRSTFLTHSEVQGKTMAEVNALLLDRLDQALEGETRKLDLTQPAILLAHAMVDRATYGAERFLAVGKGLDLPLSLLARPAFDYVALGHVHRFQILGDRPLTAYAGSLDRVDFSEEQEDKGFIVVQFQDKQPSIEFLSLAVRSFQTIRADLRDAADPLETLLALISKVLQPDAVVRLIYQLQASQLAQIDLADVKQALGRAHVATIQPHVITPLTDIRAPDLQPHHLLTPLEALKLYCQARPQLVPLQEDLLTAAMALLAEDFVGPLPLNGRVAEPATPYTDQDVEQLPLL